MTRTEQMGFVRIAAESGYLYNGDMVVSVVCAPVGADLSAWQEISQEEGDAIKTERAAARAAALAQAQAALAAEMAAEREEHAATAADAADEATPTGNE